MQSSVRSLTNTCVNDLTFSEKINLLPGPDRRYDERFDYVVCRPDHLGRVDFDNEISRGFVIKGDSDISKT